MTLDKWLIKYIEIIKARLEFGEIKEKTFEEYMRSVKKYSLLFGSTQIDEISVKSISDEISRIKNSGKNNAAYRFKLHLVDVFNEAQSEGVVVLGFNPALAVNSPVRPVKTRELTIQEWISIYTESVKIAPSYIQKAMQLALITGQEAVDLVNFKYENIENDILHIRKIKTGERMAFHIGTRLHAIDASLETVLTTTNKKGYILTDENGRQAKPKNLAKWFAICRKNVLKNDQSSKQPPFRSQVALSKRLYQKQGFGLITFISDLSSYSE